MRRISGASNFLIYIFIQQSIILEHSFQKILDRFVIELVAIITLQFFPYKHTIGREAQNELISSIRKPYYF